ncbi:MAG: hypothetical protein Q9186_005266 [Xanthomendoza sp. 1 TL-2023]
MASFLLEMWHPLVDAFFAPPPLQQRWRLLLFLPVTLLLYPIKSIPYLFSRPFVTYRIPTRRPGESIRALVYNHPSKCPKLEKKRPLHIDVHAGGFVGGIPEADAPFCTQVAESTGAVVVAVTYRFAPRHPFPAAPDDIADALAWLVEHAGAELEADAKVITLSGFSAGGAVGLGGTLGSKDIKGRNIVKGAVTFYSLVDLRLTQLEKRKPPGYPPIDPAQALLPLFDTYAGPSRMRNLHNPRMHPTLASLHDLPEDMLFVIPTVDITLYEQMEMVERLQREAAVENEKRLASHNNRRIEKMIFEGQWHGWLECTSYTNKRHPSFN